MANKVSGSTIPKQGSPQLKLSDVIRIVAPENQLFNHQLFFIDYIDEERINLVNLDTMDTLKLRIHEGGILGDGTIEEIIIVSRSELEGYARQHGLVVGKWINVYFDGPTPSVITGEITNLESDMIEVRVFNDPDDIENDYLYFNFDYKGLPQNVHINRIELRPAPDVSTSIEEEQVNEPLLEKETEETNDINDDEVSSGDSDLEEGEIREDRNKPNTVDERTLALRDYGMTSDDSDLEEGEIRETRDKPIELLDEYIVTSRQRNIGASLDMVETMETVDKSKERYTLNAQTDDLLDDLMMKQESSNRGFRNTNNIAIEIERFIQLRETFSLMDSFFNVTGVKVNTDDWKPLVEDIVRMRHNLLWVVPVTKISRNIYDEPIPIDEDIVDIQSRELIDDIDNGLKTIEQAYMTGSNSDIVNKYRQYISGINTAFSSFGTPDIEDKDIISTIETPIDQYTVINNLTNFRSSCISGITTSGITTSRMTKQQYLAPTNLLVTRDPNMNPIERTHRVPVSMGDSMAIRSIMTLPRSITRFSRVNRSGTSIDKKSHTSTLYPLYFKTLGRKTKINNVIIDSIDTSSKYSPVTSNNFTNYHMGTDLAGISFEKYVQSIIPTTTHLIDIISPTSKNMLNFHNFVTLLEPFSIYTHDITKTQLVNIRKNVNNNIIQFVADKKTRWKLFSRINGMKHSNQFSSNAITELTSVKFSNLIATYYNRSDLNYSSSELLSKIIHLDHGTALTDIISRETADILVHEKVDNMLNIFREDTTEEENKKEEEKDPNKCKMVIITKQYFSNEEMERDNNNTIYFDRKYDDTNYMLLIKKKDPFVTTIEKFDAEYAKMTPENFFMFVQNKVRGTQPNIVSDADVEHLTETLINGKKRVRDGDYALLHDNVEGMIQYFKRINDTWKLDKDMSNQLPTDSMAMNCGLEPGCVYNELATSAGDKCVPVTEAKSIMHANILKEIINRFDEKLAASADELHAYLTTRIMRSEHLINVLKSRRTRELCKYDRHQFAIGSEMIASGVMNTKVRSPHLELRDKILAQKDLNVKYSDILHFINKYTEECADREKCDIDIDSSRRWRYCKETKTQLLPGFMHELAIAWLEDGNNYTRPLYQHALQRIIREIGAESDDGAYWVDKFSGETIARKDFDTEEGFENGHKIVSRGASEEEFDTQYLREIRQAHATVVKYTTPMTQTIYRVASAIAGFMNITLVSQMEFIVKIASATVAIPGVLPTSAAYQQSVAKAAVDGKKMPPYETIYNESIMFSTLGATLIGIQTAVPSVTTKKTYPGCIRSFSGYPLDGDGDTSGLSYLACVSRKGMTTSGIWSVLRRKSPENIMKKIKLFIESYYMSNLDVTEKINAKREYIMEHPNTEVPDENQVEKWNTFMPPLYTVHLPRLQPVVSGFKDLLISDIKTASSAQWSKLNVIQGKIVQYSLAYQVGIQQIINEVKGHRDTVDELFIDEFGVGSLGKTQYEYFSNLNGELQQSEGVLSGMQSIISDVKRLSRALTIFCNINDKNARATLGKEYSEVTIYKAFISICRFNRQELLDDDLSDICGGKPDTFSNSDAISEKIRKLKDAGKVYDGAFLDKLLRLVGAKNQVSVQYDNGLVTQVQRLRNTIVQCRDAMADDEQPIAEVMRSLDIVLDTFDYDTYRSSPEVRTLRNVLSRQNDIMRKNISLFISDNVAMPPAHAKTMNAFLTGITSWEEDESEKNDHSSTYYNLFSFINTYIHNMIKVFPNAIQSKVDHSKTMAYSTAKRNSISRKAVDAINTIAKGEYDELEKIYDNPDIKYILTAVTKKCDTIRRMAENTPYFTEIPVSGDKSTVSIVSVLDKTTCKMLFEHYLLSTLHSYVELSGDDTLLNLDAETSEYSIGDIHRQHDNEHPSVDPSIYMSDMKKMRSATANLLHQYIRIMHNHKSIIESSYSKVSNINFRIREGEKELITTRLERMKDQADRDLDNIKKANKQGVWGKGMQKSLRFHVKDDYDNERDFADKMQEIESHIRSTNHSVTDENLSQYQDDYLADMDRQVDEDDDERNLSRIRGDDANGDPYGEEGDDDDDY